MGLLGLETNTPGPDRVADQTDPQTCLSLVPLCLVVNSGLLAPPRLRESIFAVDWQPAASPLDNADWPLLPAPDFVALDLYVAAFAG